MNLSELNDRIPVGESIQVEEDTTESQSDVEDDLFTSLALLDEVRELLNDIVVVHVMGAGKMYIPTDKQKDVFRILECVNDFVDQWDLVNQEK